MLLNADRSCVVCCANVACCCGCSSGVIWEEKGLKKRSKRFKKLPIKLSEMLEEAYQKYQEESRTGKRNAVRTIGKAEVRRAFKVKVK